MTFYDERRLLFYLAKTYFQGTGVIVDGGAFIGGSALCFGLGLKERNHPAKPVIRSYDRFIIDQWSVDNYLKPPFSNDPVWEDRHKRWSSIVAGDGIRTVFDEVVAPVAEYIDTREGDFRDQHHDETPIEILFADISKSWELNDHLIREFIPHLVPGRSVLVHQDYIQEFHPWIAISMEVLMPYFEWIDYTPGSTMLFLCKKRIPHRAIERAMSGAFDTAAMVINFNRAYERFAAVRGGRYSMWARGMFEACRLTILLLQGEVAEATGERRRMLDKYRTRSDVIRRVNEVWSALAPREPSA